MFAFLRRSLSRLIYPTIESEIEKASRHVTYGCRVVVKIDGGLYLHGILVNYNEISNRCRIYVDRAGVANDTYLDAHPSKVRREIRPTPDTHST